MRLSIAGCALVVALVGLLGSNRPVRAQQLGPPAAWTAWINIDHSTAMSRARAALTSRSLAISRDTPPGLANWFTWGTNGSLTASIACCADDDTNSFTGPRARRVLVTIVVVSTGVSGDALRDYLGRFMETGAATNTEPTLWTPGEYVLRFNVDGVPKSAVLTLRLTSGESGKSGSGLAGGYTFLGGSVSGSTKGNLFQGTWKNDKASGLFEFRIEGDGRFSGWYALGNNTGNKTPWGGEKR